MNDIDEQWVMQPVRAGLCRYESLVDGTLMLEDIARMNEFIAVQNENESRVHDAAEDYRRG